MFLVLMCLAEALAARPLGEVTPWMEEELERASAIWAEHEVSPHYVAIAVRSVHTEDLVAADGALSRRLDNTERLLDVDLRMGTPALDSTRELRGLSFFDDMERDQRPVAWDGPGTERALRASIREELDARHRHAAERLALIDGEITVRVEAEDPAPDFEVREPLVFEQVPPMPPPLPASWTSTLVDASELLDRPDIVEASVRLLQNATEVVQVDTEGARIHQGWVRLRLSLQARVVADDGDDLTVYRVVDVVDPSRLPDREATLALAREVASEALALRAAPRATPYTGPVLLSGRASGVFLHEVLGHRAEGHRNKSDFEGKTFLEYIGESVLPDHVDVVDDPTLARFEGVDLSGHYEVDDEGVAAQRAVLVQDGVFKGFLMGRSPLAVQLHSNGHGRRSPGRPPTSRMGVTMLTSDEPQSDDVLHRQLVGELRAQGLPFGYRIEDIDGGFTLTGRTMPNAFNVVASRTMRVYADGRPDELVRGIDLVGTPLVAFRSLIGVGDDHQVFNGVCGAESGWVPVSAVAPSMLFRRLEMQRKDKESTRPPLLSKPAGDAVGVAP